MDIDYTFRAGSINQKTIPSMKINPKDLRNGCPCMECHLVSGYNLSVGVPWRPNVHHDCAVNRWFGLVASVYRRTDCRCGDDTLNINSVLRASFGFRRFFGGNEGEEATVAYGVGDVTPGNVIVF